MIKVMKGPGVTYIVILSNGERLIQFAHQLPDLLIKRR